MIRPGSNFCLLKLQKKDCRTWPETKVSTAFRGPAIQHVHNNNVVILPHSSRHNPETWFALIVVAYMIQVHVVLRVLS